MDKPSTKGRILAILVYLKFYSDEDHPVTTADIISYLESNGYSVTSKTLKDDIEVLQKYNFDIIMDNHGDNVYFLADRQFQITDIKLLTDAVAASRVLSAQQSVELINKILNDSSKYQREALAPKISVFDRRKPDDNKMYYNLFTVIGAINDKKQISYTMIDYAVDKTLIRKNNGEIYVLSPYECVWNDDAYYLIGYSEKHGKIITPRLDRIHDVIELEADAYPRPDDKDLLIYTNSTIYMYDGELKDVDLICDNDLMIHLIDRFGKDFKVEVLAETYFKATVNVSVSRTFMAWVFQFAGKMSISGPEDVRRRYQDMIRKVGESMGLSL